MLDEQFRRKVERVSTWSSDTGGEPELDEAARERIIRSIGLQGPALVRRSRRGRIVALVAGPLLAAAAAVAVYVTRNQTPPQQVAQGPAAAEPTNRACESRALPVLDGTGFVSSGGRLRLDLEPLASAVAAPDTSVRVDVVERCKTVIALTSGSVLVHARDLGGGSLVVRSGNVEVVVQGTLFAVTQAPESSNVEVVEGRVVVRRSGHEYRVTAGERLTLSSLGVATARIGDVEARKLRQQMEGPEVVGIDSLPPALDEVSPDRVRPSASGSEVPGAQGAGATSLEESVSTADLLALAEAARRDGRHAEARTLYRQAGGGSGPTAEAAWLSLARMELALGNIGGAREATEQRRRRFGTGTLGPEAAWIDVRIDRQAGDLAKARRSAEEVVRTWPGSPQAVAAKRWLGDLRREQ